MLIHWPNYFEVVCRNRWRSCPWIAVPVTVTWLVHSLSTPLFDRSSWRICSVTEIRSYVMFTNDYIFLDTLILWFLKWGRERHEYRVTSQNRKVAFGSVVDPDLDGRNDLESQWLTLNHNDWTWTVWFRVSHYGSRRIIVVQGHHIIKVKVNHWPSRHYAATQHHHIFYAARCLKFRAWGQQVLLATTLRSPDYWET
jgi:hypothetical protein